MLYNVQYTAIIGTVDKANKQTNGDKNMEYLTTQQIQNALIEMETMQTNPDISAASVLACNELEKRMGEDAFNEWFDSI